MEDFQFDALSPENRIAKQRELKQRGFYVGDLDGTLGPKTRQALAMERAMQRQQPQGDPVLLRRLEMQAERERRAAAAKTQREQGASPVYDVFAPAAAGAVVGGLYGELTNRGLDRFEAGNAAALREIGEELGPTKDLTSSQVNRSRAVGAAEAAKRFAPQTTTGKVASAAGRLASYGIPAAVIMNEFRRYKAMADDDQLSESERIAYQRLANGFLGVGTGIGADGGRRFFFPSRPEGIGRAEMRVRAARDLAQRMDKTDMARAAQTGNIANDITPPARTAPAPVTPATAMAPSPRPVLPAPVSVPAAPALPSPEAAGRTYSERLVSAAKAGGANLNNKRQAAKWLTRNIAFLPPKERAAIAVELGVNRGPRFVSRLKEAVSSMANKTGRLGILAPLAGAAVGWEMAGDEAQASTGGDASDMSVLRRKAEGAAIGGAAAGGAAYGMRKLAETPVGQTIGRSAAGLTGALSPMMIDAMTDYTPEDKEIGRQFLARNLPDWMQSDPIRAAGAREQMGMTPEQTDAAFEDALAQFEATRLQREDEPDASPLRRLTAGPATPAQFMARRYR